MEAKNKNCTCSTDNCIVMACSGASDVGQISDLAARQLRDNKVYKMNCLAVAGAGIEESIQDFKTKELLIIDGCPVDCGKRIMQQNKISNFKHLRLSDIGLEKGLAPANKKNVQLVYNLAKSMQ